MLYFDKNNNIIVNPETYTNEKYDDTDSKSCKKGKSCPTVIIIIIGVMALFVLILLIKTIIQEKNNDVLSSNSSINSSL